MRRVLFLTVLIATLFVRPTYVISENQSHADLTGVPQPNYKSPVIASVLNLYPTLGHLYAGNWLRGATVWTGYLGVYSLMQSQPIGLTFSSILIVGGYAYTYVDAVATVRETNKKRYQEAVDSEQKQFDQNQVLDTEAVALSNESIYNAAITNNSPSIIANASVASMSNVAPPKSQNEEKNMLIEKPAWN